ncbi:MAG: MGMT family protein [Deltaproteobacteria bacterium]
MNTSHEAKTFPIDVCGHVLLVTATWEADRLCRIHLALETQGDPHRMEETGDSKARALAAHLLAVLKGDGLPMPYGLPLGTAFQRRVWEATGKIPCGCTASYQEIAQAVGCRAPRAVGQALKANPWPILVPCHRVVAHNGHMGGYSLGAAIKRLLLAAEKGGLPT